MSQLISECTYFTENSATLLHLLVVNNIDVTEFSGVGDNVIPNYIPLSNFQYFKTSLISRTFKRKMWSFPYKTMSRPSDPPWMHNDIRKFIRVRKRHHNIAKHTNFPGNEKYLCK